MTSGCAYLDAPLPGTAMFLPHSVCQDALFFVVHNDILMYKIREVLLELRRTRI